MIHGNSVWKVSASAVDGLMRGAIDMHIHCGPDIIPRKADVVELVAQAKYADMGGLVFKCHQVPTVLAAYVLQREYPDVRIYSMVCANSSVGGLNPEAIDVALKMGARVVYLPTVSAAHHLKTAAHSAHFAALGGGTRGAGITVTDEAGALKPEVIEIMQLAKDAGAILQTGHISMPESKLVVEQAARMCLEKIVVTHPELAVLKIPLSDQRDMAKMGAYFERDYAVMTHPTDPVSGAEIAEAIRTLGPERNILASDFGQMRNPLPVEGMRSFIAAMLDEGISEKDVEIMVRHNPAQLLG